MTEAIHYGAMKPGEEGRVSNLVTRVFQRHVAPLFSEGGIQEFLKYVTPGAIQERSKSNHFLLVARADARIIGAIEVRDYDHVSLLFVETSHQRQGIARELLRRALVECCAQRPELREIDVNSSPNAVPAYQRLGFRQQGSERLENGIRFVPMALSLPRCDQVSVEGEQLLAPVIREAIEADFEALRAIFEEVDQMHRRALPQLFKPSEGSARARSYVVNAMGASDVGLFVAEIEGQLMGLVHVIIRDVPAIPILVPRRYAVVEILAVGEAHRRRGVGRALMERAETWATAGGATSIELNVYAFNRMAQDFYGKLGYEILSRKMSRSLGATPGGSAE